jgi:poly-gamma-glutamate capsule biosynthesis protein CapA/YwtB (metallophosphatase superfamily)
MHAPADSVLPAPARPVTLFLCGDVMTGRGIDQILPHPGAPLIHEPWLTSAADYVRLAATANGPVARPVDFAYPWGDALAVLDRVQPQRRIVNLETSVTTSDDWQPKGINYRMHPANAACIKAARIDCCTLANNHVLDWGEAGLEETLAVLARQGIQAAGAGRDLAAAQAPAILPAGPGNRVLVYAMGTASSGIPPDWAATPQSPGVHLVELSENTAWRLAQQISLVRRPGDLVVASIHWGGNWGYAVPGQHRTFAHQLVEMAGVDIVHGHSSHHPLGIEVYRHRPIFYGCGDFLNDYEGITGYEAYHQDLMLMYFPVLDAISGQLLSLRLVPMHLACFQLHYTAPAQTGWLIETLNREGEPFGTHVEPDGAQDLLLHWDTG